VKTGKHTDPVWQVKWAPLDLSEKDLKFYSVSSDGRVTRWQMSKSELVFQDVMELKLVSDTGGEGDDVSVKGELDENDTYAGENDASLGALAGGCCVDFNKQQDHLFIVGTEEGRIHKCSTAYNSQYIETYRGHHMAVYTTKWNEHAPNGAYPRVSQIQRPRTLRFPNLTRLLDGRL
jgi:dynein intermediate chain 1